MICIVGPTRQHLKTCLLDKNAVLDDAKEAPWTKSWVCATVPKKCFSLESEMRVSYRMRDMRLPLSLHLIALHLGWGLKFTRHHFLSRGVFSGITWMTGVRRALKWCFHDSSMWSLKRCTLRLTPARLVNCETNVRSLSVTFGCSQKSACIERQWPFSPVDLLNAMIVSLRQSHFCSWCVSWTWT